MRLTWCFLPTPWHDENGPRGAILRADGKTVAWVHPRMVGDEYQGWQWHHNLAPISQRTVFHVAYGSLDDAKEVCEGAVRRKLKVPQKGAPRKRAA